MTIATENLPDDIATLKQLIADLTRDAVAQTEIAKLKFQLARYRRAEFGRSSEKLARDIAQLELAIESVETDQAERLAGKPPAVAALVEAAAEAQKPARRPLPEHLPREEVVHPAPFTCPSCGGALRKIGEDVTQTLDYVPGRFKVIRHRCEKLACRALRNGDPGAGTVSADCPRRAGAGLLAHIVVSKYDDHLPLYRQAEIYAREGVDLETSTLSGWVGATTAALAPLTELLAADVMTSETLHGDHTPVPVLAPGSGKTKTGRLWTYVRDEKAQLAVLILAGSAIASPSRSDTLKVGPDQTYKAPSASSSGRQERRSHRNRAGAIFRLRGVECRRPRDRGHRSWRCHHRQNMHGKRTFCH